MSDEDTIRAVDEFRRQRRASQPSSYTELATTITATVARLKQIGRSTIPILVADDHQVAPFIEQSPQPNTEFKYKAEGLNEAQAWPLGYSQDGSDLYLTEGGAIVLELLGVAKYRFSKKFFLRLFFITEEFYFYGKTGIADPGRLTAHLRSFA